MSEEGGVEETHDNNLTSKMSESWSKNSIINCEIKSTNQEGVFGDQKSQKVLIY